MRKLLVFIAFAASALAQPIGGGGNVPIVTTTPATCIPNVSPAVLMVSANGTSGALYYCSAVNTWSASGGSGTFTSLTGDAESTATGGATTILGLNGTNLGGLASGLLFNTTGTGVPSVRAVTGSGGICAVNGACTWTAANVFSSTINKITFTAPSTAWTIQPTGDNQTTTIPNGTLVNTGVTSLSSLTSASSLATIGTIGTGTWQGTVVAPTYGGSGVANAATHTLGSSNQNWATLGTGIVKNTTTTGALSNAASSDVYGLWSGSCSSSTFLRGDGACAAPAGSGNTTSTSLTNNHLSKANGANSIIDSNETDDGTTFATTLPITTPSVSTGSSPPSVTAGTGGVVALGEGTAPSVCVASSVDCVYSDSTFHGLLTKFNGASTWTPLVTGPVSVTSGHGANWSAEGVLSDSGAAAGTVTSAVIAGTSNQITVTGTCTITSSGTCTLSLPAAIITGTDNSTAGTLQLANGSANAHTIWGSGATTSNTILGFTVAPTTGDLIDASVSGTTTTLHDSGVLTANVVTAASAASAANQVCVASGGTKSCSYIDFPERFYIPAANCNNTTAGAGWSIPSGGTVTCRAGTNNLGGYITITDTSSTFAQFTLMLPNDWDSATRPYIRFYFSSGSDTTNGHTVIPQVKVSCPTAANGTTSDDATFSAAQSSSTVTFGASAVANGFYNGSNVQFGSTQMTGCIAGGMMIVQVGRATDTATGNINFYGADVTFPRLLVVGAQ